MIVPLLAGWQLVLEKRPKIKAGVWELPVAFNLNYQPQSAWEQMMEGLEIQKRPYRTIRCIG